VIDPDAGTVELVNAGHYPPVLVGPDGVATFARTPPRRPLGTDPDTCVAADFPYRPGDTLLLYTDGLVERRSEHIDLGLARIEEAAGPLAGPDLPAALAALVAQVRLAAGDDDVTAVAVRRS
jgi:serine phosphatase RsbU (regulator of sigma subunit)